MAGYPPPYPPPGPPSVRDQKYQRRVLRDRYRYQMRGMRRRSIIGPVLVILIGIVFLLMQTGHLRADHVWNWYGHWWPLLLITVGVVHLIEWGIDSLRSHDPQQPYFRRTLGAGALTLIVLLAITGIFFNGIRDGHTFFSRIFSINSDNFEEFLGNKHESDESRTETISAGSGLTIDSPRGDISITGTSSDNQVHLVVHKQIYSYSDADAENRAHELTPQITNTGKSFSVTLPNLRGAVADVSITIPASTAVTITANHGDVHVDSVNAPVSVTANHGDIELSSITGPVAARVNNSGTSIAAHSITGPLSIEGRGRDLTLSDILGSVVLTGDFYGTTHLEHIAQGIKFHTSRTDAQLARLDGDMEITSDAALSVDQALGPVMLTTRNRNIDLQRISGDLSVTNRNGSVDLTSAPPLGNITVQNRNGSVSLTLPDKANFSVSAETKDGDIENDFSLPTHESNSRKTLNGTVGKGGTLIRINTTQGDISVRKASIAPLSLAPPTPPAPHLAIKDQDGSSVYVGKDGIRIINGADGSSAIVSKEGLRITNNADGSSVYKSADGARLTEAADGSKVFVDRDGTRYTTSNDGNKDYQRPDGTRITISSNGRQVANGSRGKSMSDSEARDRLQQIENHLHHAEQQRDAELRNHHKDN